MGFDTTPPNKPIVRRGDDICPLDGTPMTGGTIIARIPRQTHTDVRRIHIACVPVDSPDYPRAVELLNNH